MTCKECEHGYVCYFTKNYQEKDKECKLKIAFDAIDEYGRKGGINDAGEEDQGRVQVRKIRKSVPDTRTGGKTRKSDQSVAGEEETLWD